jgi:DNA polymerase III subunit delta'
MGFRDFPDQQQGVQLLQRSLQRGRLAHAYLFSGGEIGELEALAQTLAKTLNCLNPVRGEGGVALDSCDGCLNCRKIEHGNHADVHWVRPESKSRVIVIDQMRQLMQDINLKPTEAEYKTAIVSGADRLNVQAANAFLKTLEEPPPKSIIVLLTTDPQRILETIISRCLRLSFAGEHARPLKAADAEWLKAFGEIAAAEQKSLLGRYRVLDALLQRLNQLRERIEASLTERSPLQRYEDAEKDLREKWEDELKAAIEAEYRRNRSELLLLLQRWFRDVWLHTLQNGASQPAQAGSGAGLLMLPEAAEPRAVAQRLTTVQALENLRTLEELQRLLYTNVQEALALEVGLLKLHL